MLLQRWEAKICQKENLPQLGIELTTTTSWVRHAHHWAAREALPNNKIQIDGNGRKFFKWIELINWIVFYAAFTVFQSYHSDSSHYQCHPWISPALRLGSELSCLWTLPQKTQKNQGSSVARTQDPWITSQTLYHWAMWEKEKMPITSIFSFSKLFSKASFLKVVKT